MKRMKQLTLLFLGLIFMGLQGCTHEDRDYTVVPVDTAQLSYDAADAVNGARLYNDFTAEETGFVGPVDPNVNLAHITEGRKDFYRCKQCHAWDLKAKFGSYIDRGPRTGRPDVSDVQLTNLRLADITELFEGIKGTGGGAVNLARTADGTKPELGGNDHPDFGTILSDELIWDLVKYLKEGAFDTDGLYAINTVGAYPTGKATYADIGRDGNATAGDAFYAINCASCHGADGQTLDLEGRKIGRFAREKPYELQIKVVSGQLGSSMGHTPTTFEDMKNLLKALADETKYPN